MPTELSSGQNGYWAGMPKRLRTRFLLLAVYYLISGYVVAMGHWLGIALLVAPALWWLFRVWLLGEVLGVRGAGRQGLVGYTFSHIWNASVYVRAATAVSVFVITLSGLGWLGTIELREERAKPTLTERAANATETATDKASELAGNAVDTGKGWVEKAKSWFD